uniref:Uncharacterized protein n=1 Tax=Ascaris lumbricoides TaxID=6252 RepID=A0A0M3IIJ7_ASCLU
MSQGVQLALHRRMKGVKMQIQVIAMKGYVDGYMKSDAASEFDRVGFGSSQVEGRERGSVGMLKVSLLRVRLQFGFHRELRALQELFHISRNRRLAAGRSVVLERNVIVKLANRWRIWEPEAGAEQIPTVERWPS